MIGVGFDCGESKSIGHAHKAKAGRKDCWQEIISRRVKDSWSGNKIENVVLSGASMIEEFLPHAVCGDCLSVSGSAGLCGLAAVPPRLVEFKRGVFFPVVFELLSICPCLRSGRFAASLPCFGILCPSMVGAFSLIKSQRKRGTVVKRDGI